MKKYDFYINDVEPRLRDAIDLLRYQIPVHLSDPKEIKLTEEAEHQISILLEYIKGNLED